MVVRIEDSGVWWLTECMHYTSSAAMISVIWHSWSFIIESVDSIC